MTNDLTMLGQRFGDAVIYASQVHHDQRRKGTDTLYMAHLLGAASLVLDQGGDEDEAIAALLHDALEDQADRTSEDEIRGRFGDKVARIVVACSDHTGSGEKAPWRERKERYLAHLSEQPTDVLRVSLADKLHNARAIVTDLRTAGEEVWDRFTGDPQQQAWYYRSLADTFKKRAPSPLADEFAVVVDELMQRAEQAPPRPARD